MIIRISLLITRLGYNLLIIHLVSISLAVMNNLNQILPKVLLLGLSNLELTIKVHK